MSFSCNGECEKHKARRPIRGSRYANGQKSCSICEIFMEVEDIFCPCCRTRLRTKPRTKGQKEQMVVNRI